MSITGSSHRATVERERMVESQLVSRGITDPAVLEAFRRVPREAFLPDDLAEFAYEDAPLPIEMGQTISQPYIVARMAAALELKSSDRVLEIGTGSGYAAAILACIASEVYTVERHETLARLAVGRLRSLGFSNIHVLHGDGTLGWQEHAPYEAIIAAASGPDVPPALLAQLTVGGRLVMPVGPDPRLQKLIRVNRHGKSSYRRQVMEPVQFVPLIGAEGWDEASAFEVRPARVTSEGRVVKLLKESSETIDDIQGVDLGSLLERIGDARVVLLGEATHGTSEFYRMRARITQELIERKGFGLVAVEADWPDADTIDRYVRWMPPVPHEKPFSRFPQWMWRNREVLDFVEWLRARNARTNDPTAHASFHGLDLYSLYTSIRAVLDYLEGVDPEAAKVARHRYGCLSPWEADPTAYGRAAATGAYRNCEEQAVAMLRDLLRRRIEYTSRDGDRFMGALQNARLIASGERYYRAMFAGVRASWNLRDQHMFDTLELLLTHRGPDSKAVVWEHNSHVGDAAATEMGARGEHNVGHLSRQRFGDAAFLVGFGTHHGTVAAASDWDMPMEVMEIRPSHPESYERLFHEAGLSACFLHLRDPVREAVREELMPPRLERAIGVVYRPDTEIPSHYFQAILPRQFDEYIWFDQTKAVRPLEVGEVHGMPDTYPFGV
jgi:protein-L-isoaspartate(D-aspartate) O-methyltransferase